MTDVDHLVDRLLAAAGDREQLEVFAVEDRTTDVTVLDGEVESLTAAVARGVGVRVVRDGREGYAYRADPGDDELGDLLEEARANAALGDPDDAAGLPVPAPPAAVEAPFDPALGDTPIAQRIALALALERAARGADRRVTATDLCRYTDHATTVRIRSSLGVDAGYQRTGAAAYIQVVADDGADQSSGFGFTLGPGPGVLAIDAAGREAAQRAVRLLGATKPTSGRMPVVLDPVVAASVLGVLASALDAEAVLHGRSVLAGRTGDTIAADGVVVVDDGTYPGGPATAPVDDEGVPQQRTVCIDRGVLRSFLHRTATARRSGVDPTGNAHRAGFRSPPRIAPTNLILGATVRAGGSELIATVERGVYVQEVMGLHSGADPITGEFSVSFAGLAIRGGELAEPVREAAVATTLIDLLAAITAVGDDLRFLPFGGALGGATVVVGEATISGR